MKSYIKGGIIGIVVWIVLLLTFVISDSLVECVWDEVDEFGFPPPGLTCWNPIEEMVLAVFSFLSFPFLLLGANPNLSSVGPRGVMVFWIGSAISFILWGMLAGWIIGKIKSKNK